LVSALSLHRVIQLLWFGGFALVVLSWTGGVSPTLGWTGAFATGIAALISGSVRRTDPPPSHSMGAELERLANLKERGVLSPLEFDQAKRKLLEERRERPIRS
jgi:hypothetical protein